ncbi:bactofilin family protein [Paenibacillus taiwanensis]|uniref:bactofilin family protein n=1 Tax=Paenibacillus taiwanensis TaxID=401638 RepID=UPI00041D7EEC|nr:polymer-forming cytoskeletal protein [Paenibacillus taiwanensis]
MFKSNKASVQPTNTLIGYGTQVEGKLICETSLRIEGNFRGEIECSRDVVIGESGIAHSSIQAADIVIAGQVHGDMRVSGKLTITPTGRLYGNITSGNLIIHEGATFVGASIMSKDEDSPVISLQVDNNKRQAAAASEQEN